MPADQDRKQSVLVTIQKGNSDAPRQIELTFPNRAELRNEFRANLSTGGVFVPTEEEMELNERVELALHYPPMGQRVKVDGTVVCSFDADQSGFGINIDTKEVPALDSFLDRCMLWSQLPPDLPVTICPDTAPESAGFLSPEERLILSHLDHSRTVSDLFVACADLGFDIESTLVDLERRQVVMFESQDEWSEWSLAVQD